LRYQEIDRVSLLAILVGLKVIYDNDVDDVRSKERLSIFKYRQPRCY